MKLSTIRVPRRKVFVDDTDFFEVRAISGTDLMLAVSSFGPALAMAFAKVKSQAAEGALDNQTVVRSLMSLTNEFPKLTGAVIALASDDFSDTAVDVAMSLPVGAQIMAIQTILELTLASEGTVKKLVESLTQIMMLGTETLSQVMQPLQAGTGASAVN